MSTDGNNDSREKPMTDEELTLFRAQADHEQRHDTWLWFSTASNAAPRLLATITARDEYIAKLQHTLDLVNADRERIRQERTLRSNRAAALEEAIRKAKHECGCKRVTPPVATGCPPCDVLDAALAKEAT